MTVALERPRSRVAVVTPDRVAERMAAGDPRWWGSVGDVTGGEVAPT